MRKTRPVGDEQLVEGASHPVVVDEAHLAAEKAEQALVVAARPVKEAVEGLASEREVVNEHADRSGRRELAPRIGVPEGVGDELGEPEATKHRFHDREPRDQLASHLDVSGADEHPLPAGP